MQPKKLEQYKYFQPIAWAVCVSFAGFVFMLTLRINDEIQRIAATSSSFDERLQNIERIITTDDPAP